MGDLAKRSVSLRKGAAPALLLAVFALPLAPIVLGRRLLVFRDAFFFHWPVKLWALDRLRHGVVPFVNFAAGSGEPLLANPNTISLYPTNLLYFVLPPAAAFNFHLLLHVAWAFFGAARLARRLGVSRDASWLAGAVFAFSGPYLSYASAFTNAAAAAAWAPWAIAESLRLVRAAVGRNPPAIRRAIASAGIAFGIQVLAGEPAISLWTAVFAVVLAATLELPRASGFGRIKGLAAGGVAAILGAALAASQILPTLAAIPYSFRGEHLFSRDQFGAGPNVPARLAENLWPLLFGAPRPLVSGAFWGYRVFGSDQPYLYSLNFGLVPIVLVVAALTRKEFRSSAAARVLLSIAATAGLLSFGNATPVFRMLYLLHPLRHLRYPVKFVLPAVLCLSLASGLAADVWRRQRTRRVPAAGLALCGLALAAGLAVSVTAPGSVLRAISPALAGLRAPPGAMAPGIFRILALDAAAGLTAILLGLIWCRRGDDGLGLLLAATLACLLPTGWLLFVSSPAAPLLARPGLGEELAGGRAFTNEMPEFRIAKEGSRHLYREDSIEALVEVAHGEIWPLSGLPFGTRYAFDEDPDGSYGFLNRVLSQAIAVSPPAEMSRLFRSGSIRYLVTPAPRPLPGFRIRRAFTVGGRTAFVHEIERPLPEFRAVSCVAGRASLSGAVTLLRSPQFDPAVCAIVRGPDSDPPAEAPVPPRVIAQRFTGNGIDATVGAASPSLAVWTVTFFKYWHALVDGRAAPVEIADGAYCGVRLPAGTHRVEIFYDERPFKRGALAAISAFLALTVLSLRSRPIRRDLAEQSVRFSEPEEPPAVRPPA